MVGFALLLAATAAAGLFHLLYRLPISPMPSLHPFGDAPRRSSPWRRLIPIGLLVASASAAAAASVQVNDTPRSPHLIVVLDASVSMCADDMNGTRFDAARQYISSLALGLTAKHPESKFSLVAFNASVDVRLRQGRYSQMQQQLDAVQIGYGTATGDALAAAESIALQDKRNAVVLLITDGQENVGLPAQDAANRLARAGIPVLVAPLLSTSYPSRYACPRMPPDAQSGADGLKPIDPVWFTRLVQTPGVFLLSPTPNAQEVLSVLAAQTQPESQFSASMLFVIVATLASISTILSSMSLARDKREAL